MKGEQDGEKKKSVPVVALSLFLDNYESTFIHIVLFFTLVPHLNYLAKIYIKIILYE